MRGIGGERAYEDPRELLARLRLGREEFCQRLLTSLILGGLYPRWNSRSVPSERGVRFLRALDELSFGDSRWTDGALFVDELDLPRRNETERGGAPDQAVVWPSRLWLIELKTEAASHRRDQLPSYYELAGYHYPGTPVDITYLTPPLPAAEPLVTEPNRYAHITWDQVAELIAASWSDSPAGMESVVRDALLETIKHLATRPADWRAAFIGAPAEPPRAAAVNGSSAPELTVDPAPDLMHTGIELAQLTAADGQQRAIPVTTGSLEELQALRLRLRDLLSSETADAALQHVRPWLWSAATSGGTPMTPNGQETGYELRISRYASGRR